MQEKDNYKKVVPKKKVALELLLYRLGQKSTRSLMAGDTANFGRIFNLGYIQSLFAHHSRYLQ